MVKMKQKVEKDKDNWVLKTTLQLLNIKHSGTENSRKNSPTQRAWTITTWIYRARKTPKLHRQKQNQHASTLLNTGTVRKATAGSRSNIPYIHSKSLIPVPAVEYIHLIYIIQK